MSKALKVSASFTAIGAAAFNLAVAQREYDITKTTRAGRVTSLVAALHVVCAVEKDAKGEILSVSIAASEQEKAKEIVRRHVVAADMFGKNDAKSLSDADEILAKAVKARTDAEKRAYENANKIWSRLLEKAGLKSNHGNAGNANAGKGATAKAESAEAESAKPIKAPAALPDNMSRAAFLTGLDGAIATYISNGKSNTNVETKIIGRLAAWRKELAALMAEDK